MSQSANTPSADADANLRVAGRRDRADTPRGFKNILCLDDFEEPARRFLPRPIFGYVQGGVETNTARDRSRSAFLDWEFMPRALISTRARHQRTTLMGRTYDLPFGFPPMGGTSLAAYHGDSVLAEVAAELNTVAIQSGASLTPMEKVRAVGPTTWFQAYLPGDKDIIVPLVERVERAGFDTLVVTVDVQVPANRENNVRTGYNSPLRPTLRLIWDCALRPGWSFGVFLRTILDQGELPHIENMGFERIPVMGNLERPRLARDGLCWEHIELIRKMWKGKLVLKGVLSPQDTRIARESGVDGVLVSSHGGRQLDHSMAPLRALPGVVAEAGNMGVMLDGGIRRGTDVLKALALGAQFVFIGRPFLYAAAIAGAVGVRHAASLLRDEISRDMAMLGVTSPAGMKRELLVRYATGTKDEG
ncbi:MAG TPA: alpha-hydroxy acid oxidase [Burkholderiales bacterium]|nr:alpha-hydroxy acid oxidase [Burkholderiales bacterium]